MNNKYQAVIFDMDGVIIDSEPLHIQVEQETCQHFHLAAPESLWDGRFQGRTDLVLFEYIVANFGDGSITTEQLLAYKRDAYIQTALQQVQLFSGLLPFLITARSKFSKVALTTSTVAALQQKIFEKFDLGKFFDVIVTGDQITYGKPDPEPYLLTVQKLQVPAAQCIVLEDALNGIISAKKAGCATVGITNSFSWKKLQEAGADFVVENYEQILEIIL